jgi:hypothetical protein
LVTDVAFDLSIDYLQYMFVGIVKSCKLKKWGSDKAGGYVLPTVLHIPAECHKMFDRMTLFNRSHEISKTKSLACDICYDTAQ